MKNSTPYNSHPLRIPELMQSFSFDAHCLQMLHIDIGYKMYSFIAPINPTKSLCWSKQTYVAPECPL